MNPEVPPITAVPGPHRVERYGLCLRADPRNLAVVRRIVHAQLRLWGRDHLSHAATMCVTELLSNVHKHAGSPECELELVNTPTGIRAGVSDTERTLPVVHEPSFDTESGRGLFLLSETVDDWGARITTTGKEVWFVLRA